MVNDYDEELEKEIAEYLYRELAYTACSKKYYADLAHHIVKKIIRKENKNER